jgi:hypothetical protein
MAKGSYPSSLAHIRYPENIGGAESRKRDKEKKGRVTIEWYYY